MSHDHGSPFRQPTGTPRDRRRRRAEERQRRRVVGVLVAVLVPTVLALGLGAVLLWPSGESGGLSLEQVAGDAPGTLYVTGAVRQVRPFSCQGSTDGAAERARCAHVVVAVGSGPDAPSRTTVDVDPTIVRAGIAPGDELRLARFQPRAGQPADYAYVDFERSTPLWWLAAAFALLVVLVARWRGLAALVGLGVSFWVLLEFMIPALLSGEDPLAVAVVACGAIMVVLLYLAHGVSIRTTTALIGTLFGLGTSAALGTWAVGVTNLTGVGSEEDLTLTAVAGQVQLSGLLLAGIVVASLGILNDVTVTQASAVWELRALDPTAPARRLFSGAMRIGRDHIASTVYTIVFAYAGSALTVLLLIDVSARPTGVILSSEALAQEIVRTLVGSIGLVLAVPLTTAVGVSLVRFARGGGAPSVAQP